MDEDDDEEDSEDLESEDEDGEELTPAMDAAILRTLARIKRKDPSIYETGKDVFEGEFCFVSRCIRSSRLNAMESRGETAYGRSADRQAGAEGQGAFLVFPDSRKPSPYTASFDHNQSKPLTIRQHALASAIKDATGSRSPSPEPLTHVEEQQKLREETIAAFHAAADGVGDEDDLLVPREKTKDEIEREEEEYRAFLEREVGQDLAEIITVDEGQGEASSAGVKEEEEKAESKKKKKGKKEKEKSGKTKQDDDQEFLMKCVS